MTVPPVYHFVLFGGQGSPSIFSPGASITAEADARSSSVATIFLSRCHAVFLEDITSLDPESRDTLGIDTSHFTSPRDLLQPPEWYHTHPVIEATTIFLCQTLHYLSTIHDDNESLRTLFDRLAEVSGFSSGILPAVVVARSPVEDDFMACGIVAFRLGFWTALRTLFFGLKNGPVEDPAHRPDAESSRSLVIRGLTKTEVQRRLADNADRYPTLQVSAISASGIVSVSGNDADLSNFRTQALSDVTTTFAHVHGWYHSGDQLQSVVQQVVQDFRWRNIAFPSCLSQAKPIRSTLDASLFDSSACTSEELVTWLAEHLLGYCVDWHATSCAMAARAGGLLQKEPKSAVKILSFGPSSGTLFPQFQPPDSRVELVDLSPFRMTAKPSSGLLLPEHQNSIAIVGMSINLPRGHSAAEFWETLSSGLNAVEEIPESRFRVSDYHSYHEGPQRRMPVRHGAFLSDPFS